MARTWFITGTSRGFGREWAEAALDRGDRVAATARDASSVDDLAARYGDNVLPMALDVTDRPAVLDALARAYERFGRLDVVVNNAGYGQFGMIEEITEQEARAQFETNVFGALWVTQGALPYLRESGGGNIIQVSSIGGVSAFPNIGIYNGSKWALEGISQALAQEVALFGIKVTLVEPQGFTTDWSGPSGVRAEQMSEYEPVREARAKRAGAQTPGDPEATGPAILKLVDAEEPPLRCFFGRNAFDIVRPDYERRIANWEEWDWLAKEAHGEA